MALQKAKLADAQQLGSSVASVYANPASTKTFVKTIILHNTNTTTETVELYNVPDSGGSLGTATAAHRFFKYTMAADETFELSPEYPIVLTDTNDSIQGKSTNDSKVTLLINGDKDA